MTVYCDGWVDYASSWIASDPQLDCVTVKADTQKLQSMACSSELPFACMQLPGSAGLSQSVHMHTNSFVIPIGRRHL